VCSRINAAYVEAESALWVPGTERIEPARVAEIVAAGEMVVARAGGRIVGSVRVRMLDADTGFFGLLAVDPTAQGKGVGSELVRFAECVSRDGGAAQMELRLLVPRDQRDPGKERLGAWYSRLGYRPVARDDFAASHPDAGALMPLDILTYRKRL
jgi:predicted N-acetyltransferase YhbS